MNTRRYLNEYDAHPWIDIEHSSESCLVKIKPHGIGRFLAPVLILFGISLFIAVLSIPENGIFINALFGVGIIFLFYWLVKGVINIWKITEIRVNREKLIIESRPTLLSRRILTSIPIRLECREFFREVRNSSNNEYIRDDKYFELIAWDKNRNQISVFVSDDEYDISYIKDAIERFLTTL